ncbi:MAG: hypothetical protein E5Y12_22505 [Mesorhizobium sp.]|nr:MAG: hypothetical protein E5Y12_22505 [Mesorhizobium sp.]
MSQQDPFSSPDWQALARESKLARQLLGNGATALGTANYADKKGDYYVAFFGLSIGIERLAKLILVADYAIESGGKVPEQKIVSKFGHRLEELLDAVETIEKKYTLALEFPRPVDDIAQSIVSCLDSFADARRGRYANFDTLGDPNLKTEFEPIQKWWSEVAEAILARHFYGTKAEKGVRARAQLFEAVMGPISMIRHTAEDGTPLTDIETASYRTGATAYVQKYGRYYALVIVRWLSDVFQVLTNYGCYTKDLDVLFGHYEHFQTYRVENEFLKTRKRWPL